MDGISGPTIIAPNYKLWWVTIDDDGWGFGGIVTAVREQAAVDLARIEYGQSFTPKVEITCSELKVGGQAHVMHSYRYESQMP